MTIALESTDTGGVIHTQPDTLTSPTDAVEQLIKSSDTMTCGHCEKPLPHPHVTLTQADLDAICTEWPQARQSTLFVVVAPPNPLQWLEAKQ